MPEHQPKGQMMISQAVRELVEATRRPLQSDQIPVVMARLESALIDHPEPADQGMLLTARALIGQQADTPEQTDRWLTDALPLLRSEALWDAYATAATSAANAAMQAGDHQQAIAHGIDALATLGHADVELSDEVLPSVTGNLGALFRELGDWSTAFDLARQSWRASLVGHPSSTIAATALLLADTALDGQRALDLAPETNREWIDTAARAALAIVEHSTTDHERSARGHRVMARVCLERGDLTAARRHMTVALAELGSAEPTTAGNICLTEGMLLHAEGHPAQALTRFDRALDELGAASGQQRLVLQERSAAAVAVGAFDRAWADAAQLAELHLRRLTEYVGAFVGGSTQWHPSSRPET